VPPRIGNCGGVSPKSGCKWADGVGGVLRTPANCHKCGEPYPWTAEKISAAKTLADEVEGLTAEDRAKLKSALDDISAGGPRAEAGAARVKRMIGKAGTAVGQALCSQEDHARSMRLDAQSATPLPAALDD